MNPASAVPLSRHVDLVRGPSHIHVSKTPLPPHVVTPRAERCKRIPPAMKQDVCCSYTSDPGCAEAPHSQFVHRREYRFLVAYMCSREN